MKLPYSNKEIEVEVKRNRKHLPSLCIYYFQPTDVPGSTLKKNLFADDAVTPFQAMGLTFLSARHFRSLMGYMKFRSNFSQTKLWEVADEASILSDDTAKSIYLAKRPNEASAIARPYMSKLSMEWTDTIRLIAYRYKMTSNAEMKKLAASTEGLYLVYAHVNDRVEGINRAPLQAKKVETTNEWLGQNRAGRTLMLVRDEIRDIPFRMVHSTEARPVKITVRVWDKLLWPFFLDTVMKVLNINKSCITQEEKEDGIMSIYYSLERDKFKAHRVTNFIKKIQDYPGMEVLHWEN